MKCSVKCGSEIQGILFLVFLPLGSLYIDKQGFLQSLKHLFHTN